MPQQLGVWRSELEPSEEPNMQHKSVPSAVRVNENETPGVKV
jgi:hypothetical protein